MMDEFEEAYEEKEKEKSGEMPRAKRVMRRVLRWCGWILFLAVMVTLFWRMCAQKTPKALRMITPTKQLTELYRVLGDDVILYYQKYEEFTCEKRNYGYFAVTNALIAPQIEQVQLVLRYNNSTLEKLPQDYKGLCNEVPDRDETVYDVTLVMVIDLTPEDATDNGDEKNLKKERYFPTQMISEKQGLHNFRKYIFDGIDMGNALAVYVDIYYKGALENAEEPYADEPYGTVRIYSKDAKDLTYLLSGSEKKSLREA